MNTIPQELPTNGDEPKTAKISVSVGPKEKLQAQFVAGALNTTESELIYDLAMPAIKQRYAEIQAKLELVA